MGRILFEGDEFIQYERDDGTPVWVRTPTKDFDREHSLCWRCGLYKPGKDDNCKLLSEVTALEGKLGITIPVWECKDFIEAALMTVIEMTEAMKNALDQR